MVISGSADLLVVKLYVGSLHVNLFAPSVTCHEICFEILTAISFARRSPSRRFLYLLPYVPVSVCSIRRFVPFCVFSFRRFVRRRHYCRRFILRRFVGELVDTVYIHRVQVQYIHTAETKTRRKYPGSVLNLGM